MSVDVTRGRRDKARGRVLTAPPRTAMIESPRESGAPLTCRRSPAVLEALRGDRRRAIAREANELRARGRRERHEPGKRDLAAQHERRHDRPQRANQRGHGAQRQRQNGTGGRRECEQLEPAAAERCARAEGRRPARPDRRTPPTGRRWRAPTAAAAHRVRARAARQARRSRACRARARRVPTTPSQPWPAASRQLCASGPHTNDTRAWSIPAASSGTSTSARKVMGRRASNARTERSIGAQSPNRRDKTRLPAQACRRLSS